MRYIAANHNGMQHSLTLKIIDKNASAAQQPQILKPLDGRADKPVRLVHVWDTPTAPLFCPALYDDLASRMASTIGTYPVQRQR